MFSEWRCSGTLLGVFADAQVAPHGVQVRGPGAQQALEGGLPAREAEVQARAVPLPQAGAPPAGRADEAGLAQAPGLLALLLVGQRHQLWPAAEWELRLEEEPGFFTRMLQGACDLGEDKPR
jgi:hypothetical protein